MSVVKRNIVANLLGGAWLTVLTVLMTPLQINILGIEAYGVVGFITTLQIAFTAFDLGLSSTLTRELAADPSPRKRASDELLRTTGTIYWISAAVIGIALAASADAIAERWFKSTTLDVALLGQSLQVIALYLALRWPVALYVGLLSGLQRMDVLNAVKVATASLRLVGGILVLLQWKSLYAFLVWTALNALIEVVAYAVACRRVHPKMPLRPGFSVDALKKVWRFSASMNVLAVLAVLIVQLDRLLISKMLTLESLGHYNLAYTAASSISFIVGAISSAVLPSLAAAHGRGPADALLERYHDADRVMLFLVGLAAFALVFHGDLILTVWVNAEAAAGAALPLALLAAGFWCSAAIANVYNVAVASGLPGRHLRVNLLSVLPYAAGLYLLIGRFGIVGAAGGWLLLNLAYAALLVPPIHHHVLRTSTRRWLGRSIVPFVLLGCASFWLPRLGIEFYPGRLGTAANVAALVAGGLLYVAASMMLFGPRIRDAASLRALLARMWP